MSSSGGLWQSENRGAESCGDTTARSCYLGRGRPNEVPDLAHTSPAHCAKAPVAEPEQSPQDPAGRGHAGETPGQRAGRERVRR